MSLCSESARALWQERHVHADQTVQMVRNFTQLIQHSDPGYGLTVGYTVKLQSSKVSHIVLRQQALRGPPPL